MQFLAADIIFDGNNFLGKDKILAINRDGTFDAIVDQTVTEPGNIQRLKGTLTPGFVNAHCHTELSHLKNKIQQQTGLPSFGKQVITQRNSFSKEEIKERAQEAGKQMSHNGIVAVGDISNGTDSFEMKASGGIFYHTFIEILALDPSRAESSLESGIHLLHHLKEFGLTGSLAPHAPYSTSRELIAKIADYNMLHGLASSIHNQESEEETRFFNGAKSGFNELYNFLNLDISWFAPPMCSSLEYYIGSLKQQRTLLVHNTYTTKKDIELVNGQKIYWCFCPSANLYIENRLPDFDLFLDKQVCLGTDSLASNTDLSIVKEATLLLQNSSFGILPTLRAMTSNGAGALGIENQFGSFIPGKNTGFNLLKIGDKKIEFLQKLNPVSL